MTTRRRIRVCFPAVMQWNCRQLRFCRVLGALIAVAGIAGCSPPNGRGAPITGASGSGSFVAPNEGPIIEARWPFWPVRMRLHPLTMLSVDPDSDQPIIEARVELLDQFGDTTKCIAQFRFELHDHKPQSMNEPAVREWNADLRDLDTNRLHYDQVTQTYLFRLGLDEGAIAGEPHLRAFVVSVTGRKFDYTIALR